MSVTTPQEDSLDYEHFVDYQLAHAQGRIKTVDVGTGVLRLITGAIAYVLAVIVLDHALVLPAGVRLGLLWAVLLAACGYVGLAVLLPGLRRISGFYVARTIEQATPEFKNSLINYLDLRRRPDEIPAGVLAALEDRAVTDLRRVCVDDKISHERLMRAGYTLAGAVVAACLAVLVNALFMHRSLADSLGRVFLPTADIAPPTRTQIVDIKPGDDPDLSRVVASTDVLVSAIVDGRVPERVTIHWSDDGGNFWREQELTPPDRQFDPWQLRMALV